jgi:ribosomal-protein-alanine N-acetyltransferase
MPQAVRVGNGTLDASDRRSPTRSVRAARWQNARMAALDIALGLADVDDAPRIAHLARDLVEAGLGWAYRPNRIRALIGEPETVTLVARVRGSVAGFAITRFGDERAHLILLAVDPRHQRRGLARQMLDWLIASARIAGIASMHVELRESNVPALAFYRSMRFSETFRVSGYYRGRETAVRMLRMLR